MIATDDDDEFDEENMPGFGVASQPSTPVIDKGKIRAREPEQLAPPSNGGPASLSGNIGSSSSGNAPRSARQTIGGVQVETRCVNVVRQEFVSKIALLDILVSIPLTSLFQRQLYVAYLL